MSGPLLLGEPNDETPTVRPADPTASGARQTDHPNSSADLLLRTMVRACLSLPIQAEQPAFIRSWKTMSQLHD